MLGLSERGLLAASRRCGFKSPFLLVGGALYRCDPVCRGATGVAEIQLLEQLRICNSAISANELVTGWREGRHLGLIKFVAETGKSDGAVYTPNWARRRGWGLGPEATLARYLQALEVLKNFPSS